MKKAIVMMLVLVTAVVCVACGSIYDAPDATYAPTETVSQESAEQANEDNGEVYYTIGMHIILPYWQDHRIGLEAAGRELDVDVVFTGENGSDAMRQVDIFEQVVKENPAGILVCPIDPEAMVEPINDAIEKGIPVVCIDTDAPKSNRLTYLGTDNYHSGYVAAQIIAESIGEKGDVGILTIPGIYSLDERKRGFTECMAEYYPDIHVVAVMNDEADPGIAANVANQMLKDNPQIVGIFGTDAASGVGAAIALSESNKFGEVKVVAFDKDSAVLDLVQEGKVEATLVQRTFTMSYYGLKMLYDYNHNRVEILGSDSDVNPLPDIVDTGIIVVTQDNVADFQE